MPAKKKLYVIHATVRYVCKSRRTGETESGQARPTIAIEATSEAAAIRKAEAIQRERVSSEQWPCVSFFLSAQLVNVKPLVRA